MAEPSWEGDLLGHNQMPLSLMPFRKHNKESTIQRTHHLPLSLIPSHLCGACVCQCLCLCLCCVAVCVCVSVCVCVRVYLIL